MKQPALFLDRDGVINIDYGYVYHRDNFEFVDGIFDLCSVAHNKGMKIVVITNQAGIARGFYSEYDFMILSKWMLNVFESKGTVITDIYFSPYHPEYGIGNYKKNTECRKPKPGMILKAASEHNLDLKNSFLIGDKPSDLEAGQAAGVGYNLLLNPSGSNQSNMFSICALTEVIPMINLLSP